MNLTSLERRSENVRVPLVVITELELGDIERQVLSAHFVERANNTALEDRPEPGCLALAIGSSLRWKENGMFRNLCQVRDIHPN
jgi:hypothetical protein